MAENDGIIKFSPVFTDYKLSKGQFLLFGNGEIGRASCRERV